MNKIERKKVGRPKQEVKMSQIHSVRLSRSLENSLKAYCLSHNLNTGQAFRKAVREMLAKELQEEEKE